MTEPEHTESKDGMGKLDIIVRLIDRYGLALVMLGIMTWFNYDAIQFERDTMGPMQKETNKVVVECTDVMRQLPEALQKAATTVEVKHDEPTSK